MMEREEKETPQEEVQEFIQREAAFRESMSRFHKAIQIEYDFALKLKQHDADESARELDRRRRLKIATLDLYDIVRYAVGTIGSAGQYIDMVPTGPGADDEDLKVARDQSVVARSMMEEQFSDIDIGYPRVRRRFIRMGVAARAGAAKLDVCAIGPYGVEIIPKVIDPRNLTWDSETFLHFNEPECDELWETTTVDYHWLVNESGYDNVEAVYPDNVSPQEQKPAEPTRGDIPRDQIGGRVTLKIGWLKNDKTEVPVEITTKRPDSSWYMACDTCGYSEHDLVGSEGYDGSQMPESMDCPRCGLTPEGQSIGTLHRIEHDVEMGTIPAFNERKRRVIIAPNCPAAGLLKDGPWPKGLTHFPYLMYIPDPLPLEPFGNSTTFLYQDLQSLKNATLSDGYDQMRRNKDLLVVVNDSLYDENREPYQHDGSGDYVAYVQTADAIHGMKQFQGSGLNPAFVAWMGQMDAELSRHRGVGQISADASQIKGMPVGTVARVQETGDVPLDEMIRILREDEQQFGQRWYELIVGNWPKTRWIEATGEDGGAQWRAFDPLAQKPKRLKVTTAPNLDMVDKAKIEAAKALIGAPKSIIRLAGKSANLPKDTIDDLLLTAAPVPGTLGPPGAPGEMPPPDAGIPGLGTPDGAPGLAPGPAGAPPLALAPAGMQ